MRITPLLLLLVLAVLAPLPVVADGEPVMVRTELVTGDFGPATTPEAALASVADLLNVNADDFVFNHYRQSLVGEHFRAVMQVDGVAIDGTAAAVHVVDGRVVKVQARGTDAVGGAVGSPISAAVAEDVALAALGTESALDVVVSRLLVPTDGQLVDTWRVSVVAAGAAGSVDVSADDGSVLHVFDDRQFATATATLFDPNPIATSGHIGMRQDVDIAGVDVDYTTDSRIADEYYDLPIRDYDLARAAAGNLAGPYVDVIGAGPMVDVLGRFDVTKTDPRFEGLMAYHHIDAIQRYFQDELGLDNINNESQLTVAVPVMGFDNSFYQPANDLVLFGAGGVDDGEDAEVIIHELGHAIHDDQVPGWGGSAEGGAMGEGFGDFLAGTYFATFEGTVRSQDTCLMEWDSTSYASGPQTCIRRMDTDKTYADKEGQVHADGEIWSKFMWNVRSHLGDTEQEKSANVLSLLLTAHFLMSDTADFAEAIGALLTTVDSTEFQTSLGLDTDATELWRDAIVSEGTAMGMPGL